MQLTKRFPYLLAVTAVTILSLGLRIYAAQRLDVDYDEPVYLGDAVDYARYMRAGEFKMLAWSEDTYEHPALDKIIYGILLLTLRPLDRLPYKDLRRQEPIAAAAAGPWNMAARHLSLSWGTLAVLTLALVNPIAGFFFGASTLTVKYTSEVYLEALPLLTSLLCALAYMRWFAAVRQEPAASRRHIIWLALSAGFLGATAASKYVYSIVGIAIAVHFVIAIIQKQLPRKAITLLMAWGSLSLMLFFAFDPYLWPHPVARLIQSLIFNLTYPDSRSVTQYDYPGWQPLRWLFSYSYYYHDALRPASAFPVNVDIPLFVLALIGLPALFQKQRFFFYWLAVGLVFLFLWKTKWPQYTLIILAPFSMAAAEGCIALWTLARKFFVRKKTVSPASPLA